MINFCTDEDAGCHYVYQCEGSASCGHVYVRVGSRSTLLYKHFHRYVLYESCNIPASFTPNDKFPEHSSLVAPAVFLQVGSFFWYRSPWFSSCPRPCNNAARLIPPASVYIGTGDSSEGSHRSKQAASKQARWTGGGTHEYWELPSSNMHPQFYELLSFMLLFVTTTTVLRYYGTHYTIILSVILAFTAGTPGQCCCSGEDRDAHWGLQRPCCSPYVSAFNCPTLPNRAVIMRLVVV